MKHIITLLLLSAAISVRSQNPVEFLKTNAVGIDSLSLLNDSIYQAIKNYDVVMVGEMHGSWEPSQFVLGLARLIAAKEGIVCVCVEIPDSKMDFSRDKMDPEKLANSTFFSEKNIDGRNGQAWFELLVQLSRDERIHIFYIDNEMAGTRDSSMYLDVRQVHQDYPQSKIVTLTGNVHNWLTPFRGERKMGGFIYEDHVNFDPAKVMSVNHRYKEGTMMNNMGQGLQLREVHGKDSILNQTLPFENYLCKSIFAGEDQYNYFLYTRKVRHSAPLR